MIHFRPIIIQEDYETLCSWWRDHHVLAVPKMILPRGWMAEASGVEIAASFLYMDPGKIGVIEWTTTNPKCAFSRDLLMAVKGLYEHLEAVAKAEGCIAVLSFVKPKGSEERIMSKMGYVTSAEDCGHRLYAKPLVGVENYHPPESGVVTCP
jgi:hypothetical protein